MEDLLGAMEFVAQQFGWWESRLRAEMQAPRYFSDVGFREKERTVDACLR